MTSRHLYLMGDSFVPMTLEYARKQYAEYERLSMCAPDETVRRWHAVNAESRLNVVRDLEEKQI